jgi:hypothetical protein
VCFLAKAIALQKVKAKTLFFTMGARAAQPPTPPNFLGYILLRVTNVL